MAKDGVDIQEIHHLQQLPHVLDQEVPHERAPDEGGNHLQHRGGVQKGR